MKRLTRVGWHAAAKAHTSVPGPGSALAAPGKAGIRGERAVYRMPFARTGMPHCGSRVPAPKLTQRKPRGAGEPAAGGRGARGGGLG
ncbi:hypothetical protein CT3_03770 [Comamonas terrigena NBRC 13299]|nr:hypothetical protein CT3_03770 [Comamonas terrigena NBRC 13299]